MSEPNALTIQVYHDIPALRDVWRDFQRVANAGPHDTWEWNDAWARTAGASTKPLIVVGRTADDEIALLMPLAIRQRGGCSVLEWFSAEQGNYAAGLFLREAWDGTGLPRGRKLLDLLLDALPPVDAVHLSNRPLDELSGWSPLAGLPGRETASAGHAFPLSSNWTQHFNARFGKRIRADLRRRERRLADQGELGLRITKSGADLEQAMDRMIADKRRWFADRGIEDFFADETLRAFYLELGKGKKGKDAPRLELYELTVGGQSIATNLGFTHDNVFYGLISSTAPGPLLRYGPGTILFRRLIEHLAERGIQRIDCGAGEDDNKLRWCTIERPRLHTIVPVSLKGHVYTAALNAKLAAKLRIKNSPRLWTMAKRMRQMGSLAKPQRQVHEDVGVGSAPVRVQT